MPSTLEVSQDAARLKVEVPLMYSILYIIGAIVVIIVVLRLLGLY